MRTGVIVYVSNTGPVESDRDVESEIQSLNITADRIEVIAPNTGHFDIPDAWWSLTVRGMQRIVCMMAELTDQGRFRLTGRELRLCG